MAPCGPVVAVAGELWEVWESGRAEAARALETLATRYEALNVSFVELSEVRHARLRPGQTCLFVTRAPLTAEVYLRLERPPGRAKVALTACKIDRNLQVDHLTTVRSTTPKSTTTRFASSSAPQRPLQRRLRGVGGHLVSVYLVNSGSVHVDFSLLLQPVAAQF